MIDPQQIAQATKNGGLAVATGGGLWAFLAENAQAIGAACALGGLALGAIGLLVNWWYLHRNSRRR